MEWISKPHANPNESKETTLKGRNPSLSNKSHKLMNNISWLRQDIKGSFPTIINSSLTSSPCLMSLATKALVPKHNVLQCFQHIFPNKLESTNMDQPLQALRTKDPNLINRSNDIIIVIICIIFWNVHS
jgi:hypothetical protein